MDALDVLDVGAEVCRVVDLVLEQDAGHFVADEICGLDGVVGLVEEVILERARGDCELEVAAGFHV